MDAVKISDSDPRWSIINDIWRYWSRDLKDKQEPFKDAKSYAKSAIAEGYVLAVETEDDAFGGKWVSVTFESEAAISFLLLKYTRG